MRLAWLVLPTLLLIGDPLSVRCLNSTSCSQFDSQSQRPMTSESQISFADRLLRATTYFDSFAFQGYRPFSLKKVSRTSLHVKALRRFFSDLSVWQDSLSAEEKLNFPLPGVSPSFDRIYAKALTSHFVSVKGQIPMAARDGFEVVSLHRLLVAGLLNDRHFSSSIRHEVQKNRELATFFLQARYVASQVVTFRQSVRTSSPLSQVNLLSAKELALDLSHLDDPEVLRRLQILLEAAIEAREVLTLAGEVVPVIYLELPGRSRVSLSDVWQKIDVSRLSQKFSPHPSHSFYRLTSLFETLKRPSL